MDREYDDSVPTITANPGELNQVWTNLIDNAVDAMAGDGTLTVRTYADARHVVVEICDNGHSMTDEVIGYGVVNAVITLVGVGLVLAGARLRARRASNRNVVAVT